MGLDMTTPSGSNQARWFTNTYLASGSDFDYEEEIKAHNKSDKVKIISQTELVYSIPCIYLALSAPLEELGHGIGWHAEQPGEGKN